MSNITFFDTETTGKYDFKLPANHPSQPYLVQLAAIMMDKETRKERSSISVIVKPVDWHIPQDIADNIHGIDDLIAGNCGVAIKSVLHIFNNMLWQSDLLVAHNIDFDKGVMATAFSRENFHTRLGKIDKFCTMRSATNIIGIPSTYKEGQLKWPSLTECMEFFFKEKFDGAHDAYNDVRACIRVFWALKDGAGQ